MIFILGATKNRCCQVDLDPLLHLHHSSSVRKLPRCVCRYHGNIQPDPPTHCAAAISVVGVRACDLCEVGQST